MISSLSLENNYRIRNLIFIAIYDYTTFLYIYLLCMIPLTPAQQQYHDLKQTVPDCILFFRLGDFYEVFHEDAKICSKILDIVLTARNKHNPDPIPMAGIPHHSADKYIHKLIHHGYKIAIAEQISQPTPGKIVSREIARIITPATYLSETSKSTATIAAITYQYTDYGLYHIARGDFVVGEYSTWSYATIEDTIKYCLLLNPQELIIDIDLPERDHIHSHYYLSKALMTTYDRPHDSIEYVRQIIGIQTLESYGSACLSGRVHALWLLFHYLSYTQKHSLSLVSRISYISADQQLLVDTTTLKNLEIITTSYDQTEKNSLFDMINHTQTAMGSRLLKKWILHPSTNRSLINNRLNTIQYYVEHNEYCNIILSLLKWIIDIPKIISLIVQRHITPGLLSKLRSVLGYVLHHDLQQELNNRHNCPVSTLQQIESLYKYLCRIIKSDPVSDDTNYIADGVDENIDHLRAIAYHSDDLLLEYQQYLIQATGISSIKLKYVLNQWYAIEISNKDRISFESKAISWNEKMDFIRRQTLKGSERYLSPYLDHLQQDVLRAKEQLSIAEKTMLLAIKDLIQQHIGDVAMISEAVAHCDIATSFAQLSRVRKYCKPLFQQPSWWSIIHIVWWRHPVVEQILPHQTPFIPNDLVFKQQDSTLPYQRIIAWYSHENSSGHDSNLSVCVHIITWPNMGGKSTYLRQNALIVLMAHCGLWVPAQEVRLSLFDAVFARIGSWDNQIKQQSTFMTEMIEVSNIINNATENSFIVFDELWRWTSTYDGLALTDSIITYIATTLRSKTLVATHYHELIDLSNAYPQIENYSVGVYETDKEIVFLKKIVAGWANKSYGIDVATLAGIPQIIIKQAKKRLIQLQQPANHWSLDIISQQDTLRWTDVLSTIPKEHHHYSKIKQLLDSIIINQTTPMQALAILAKIKDEL